MTRIINFVFKLFGLKLTVNRRKVFVNFKDYNYYIFCFESGRMFFRRLLVDKSPEWEPLCYFDCSYLLVP